MIKHTEDELRNILKGLPSTEAARDLGEALKVDRIETGEVTLGVPDLFIGFSFYPCWVELKQTEIKKETSKITVPFRPRQFNFLKQCFVERNPAFLFIEVRIKELNKGYFSLVAAKELKKEYANFGDLRRSSSVTVINSKANSTDLTWLVWAIKKERKEYFYELLCKIRQGQF